jgi:hypothetical protein
MDRIRGINDPKKVRMLPDMQKSATYSGVQLLSLLEDRLLSLSLPNQPRIDVNLADSGHKYVIEHGRLASSQVKMFGPESADGRQFVCRIEMRFYVRTGESGIDWSIDPRTFVWIRPGYESEWKKSGDLLISHVMAPNTSTLDMLVSRVDRSYEAAEKGRNVNAPGCNVRLTLQKEKPPEKKSKKRDKKIETPIVRTAVELYKEAVNRRMTADQSGSQRSYNRALTYVEGDWLFHEQLGLCYVEKAILGSTKIEVLTENGRKILLHAHVPSTSEV